MVAYIYHTLLIILISNIRSINEICSCRNLDNPSIESKILQKAAKSPQDQDVNFVLSCICHSNSFFEYFKSILIRARWLFLEFISDNKNERNMVNWMNALFLGNRQRGRTNSACFFSCFASEFSLSFLMHWCIDAFNEFFSFNDRPSKLVTIGVCRDTALLSVWISTVRYF